MVAVVRSLAILEPHVVTAEFQGREYLLVAKRPVAVFVIEVVAAILQEDSQELFLAAFANYAGIRVAVANICEAPHVRKHLAKLVWPFPRNRERADAAARNAAYCMAIRIVSERVIFANLGQNLRQEKLSVV